MRHLHEDVAADLKKLSGKVNLAQKPMKPCAEMKAPYYPSFHIDKVIDGLDAVGAIKTITAKVKVRSISINNNGESTSLDVLSLEVENGGK